MTVSTDNSAEILNEYAQKVCANKKLSIRIMQAYLRQRNTGINAATENTSVKSLTQHDWIDLNFYEKCCIMRTKILTPDIVVAGIKTRWRRALGKEKYFLNLKNPQPPKIPDENSDYVIFQQIVCME